MAFPSYTECSHNYTLRIASLFCGRLYSILDFCMKTCLTSCSRSTVFLNRHKIVAMNLKSAWSFKNNNVNFRFNTAAMLTKTCFYFNLLELDRPALRNLTCINAQGR